MRHLTEHEFEALLPNFTEVSEAIDGAPKVSVLMLTYNHASYIAQAIESVLMQMTDFQFELVIGEDCSTDGTREIVLGFQKKYPDKIRVLLGLENCGKYTGNGRINIIRTFRECRGQYVSLLEGDDYWTNPSKLQMQVDLMEANPHYSMCGTAVRVVRHLPDGSVIEVPKMLGNDPHKTEFIAEDFFSGYPMHTSTVLFRREWFEFPEPLRSAYNGDICMFALLATKGPVGYIHTVTSTWRLNCGGVYGGLSTIGQMKRFRKSCDLLDEYFEGKYAGLLREWEFRDMEQGLPKVWPHGRLHTAQFYISSIPRFLGHVPAAKLFHLLFSFSWSRIKATLRPRARLRGLAVRLVSPFSR